MIRFYVESFQVHFPIHKKWFQFLQKFSVKKYPNQFVFKALFLVRCEWHIKSEQYNIVLKIVKVMLNIYELASLCRI